MKRRMRRVSFLLAMALVLALPSVALAGRGHHHGNVPPGNSGIGQYQETVPGAGGNHTPPGGGNSGGGGGGGQDAISPATSQALASQGAAGTATANLANATAPGGAADGKGGGGNGAGGNGG